MFKKAELRLRFFFVSLTVIPGIDVHPVVSIH
jgi:hypothetical protein